MTRALSIAVVSLGLLAGCLDSELPPVVYASDSLSLSTDNPDDVCGRTIEATEERVRALQTAFGDPPAAVHYYWMPNDFENAPCSAVASACSYGLDVFAPTLGHEHELVHAARTHALPAILEEGLATYFGQPSVPGDPRQSLRAALEADIELDSGAGYTRAGHFVSFLIEIGGLDTLRKLSLQTHRGTPFAEWRPRIEQAYLMSWEELWTAYLEYPECDHETLADDFFLCHGDAEPSVSFSPKLNDDDHRKFISDFHCASPTVVGPVAPTDLITEVLVEIDEAEAGFGLAFSLIGDIVEGSSATLYGCGGCASDFSVRLDDQHRFEPVGVVPPGVFVLELRQPANAPGQLGIEISLVG